MLLFSYFAIGLQFTGRGSIHYFYRCLVRVLAVTLAEDLMITLSTLISLSTAALPLQTTRWMLGFRSQLPAVRLSFEVLLDSVMCAEVVFEGLRSFLGYCIGCCSTCVSREANF